MVTMVLLSLGAGLFFRGLGPGIETTQWRGGDEALALPFYLTAETPFGVALALPPIESQYPEKHRVKIPADSRIQLRFNRPLTVDESSISGHLWKRGRDAQPERITSVPLKLTHPPDDSDPALGKIINLAALDAQGLTSDDRVWLEIRMGDVRHQLEIHLTPIDP